MRWLVAIAAIYLYVFPYFPRIHSANELPRVYLVQSVAHEHRFAIDTGVGRWGATADVSPAGGHEYSNKAPGSSFLVVPVYAIVRALAGEPSLATSFWLCRAIGGIVPTLIFLWLLYGFLARWAPDPAVRRLVLVAYGLGSMALTYSILFYSHQLGAVCVGSAWILATDVADEKRTWRAMLAAGALAGAAPLVDYQAIFAAVPVAIWFVARVRQRPELVRMLAATAAGAVVPIAVLLLYHRACFGSPWRTGYDASTTFAMYHQQGFLGITALRGEAFVGSLLRPDNGLFALSPWWLLAFPGFALLWRRGERGVAAVGASVLVIYVLFVSSINFWRGGWQVGPRYIVAMLPFLLPPIAAQLQAWRTKPYAFGAACGLVVAGAAIYVGSAATFPYWPDSVVNPVAHLMFPMIAEGRAAPNVLSALGAPDALALAVYFAGAAALLGFVIARAGGRRALLVAAALGAVVVAAFCLYARGSAAADEHHLRSVYAHSLDS
ncbi:MAG TPA: hypothetical protein VGM88_29990 [Kofleriaceae bacterium]